MAMTEPAVVVAAAVALVALLSLLAQEIGFGAGAVVGAAVVLRQRHENSSFKKPGPASPDAKNCQRGSTGGRGVGQEFWGISSP